MREPIAIKGRKGVTLISLSIMIIVIIIIASISFNTGKDAVLLAKEESRISELKVMQSEINTIYEKYKNNEEILVKDENSVISGNEILNIGEEYTAKESEAIKAMNSVGITDMSQFRYLSIEYIQKLGIQGVEHEYLVNIETRQVMSLSSFEYDGKDVHSLEQIPGQQFNVKYNP